MSANNVKSLVQINKPDGSEIEIEVWDADLFAGGLGLLSWVREEILADLRAGKSRVVYTHKSVYYTFAPAKEAQA